MASRYTVRRDGELVLCTRWRHRIACCDCGLIHDFRFKLVKKGRGFAIGFIPVRNERSTAAYRRAHGIKVRHG
jgi:hypothetical protein